MKIKYLWFREWGSWSACVHQPEERSRSDDVKPRVEMESARRTRCLTSRAINTAKNHHLINKVKQTSVHFYHSPPIILYSHDKNSFGPHCPVSPYWRACVVMVAFCPECCCCCCCETIPTQSLRTADTGKTEYHKCALCVLPSLTPSLIFTVRHLVSGC